MTPQHTQELKASFYAMPDSPHLVDVNYLDRSATTILADGSGE